MGKETRSAVQDYDVNGIRKSDTYHSLGHVCEGQSRAWPVDNTALFSYLCTLCISGLRDQLHTAPCCSGRSLSGSLTVFHLLSWKILHSFITHDQDLFPGILTFQDQSSMGSAAHQPHLATCSQILWAANGTIHKRSISGQQRTAEEF